VEPGDGGSTRAEIDILNHFPGTYCRVPFGACTAGSATPGTPREDGVWGGSGQLVGLDRGRPGGRRGDIDIRLSRPAGRSLESHRITCHHPPGRRQVPWLRRGFGATAGYGRWKPDVWGQHAGPRTPWCRPGIPCPDTVLCNRILCPWPGPSGDRAPARAAPARRVHPGAWGWRGAGVLHAQAGALCSACGAVTERESNLAGRPTERRARLPSTRFQADQSGLGACLAGERRPRCRRDLRAECGSAACCPAVWVCASA